ncbi:MAG: ATP phosphoribosyltransferase [Bacteroidales bacterium]|jgi:ATP phosphoribosyltransferase|nr:ATP phosphoribosyltransferase [Bacteroidales bacterium]
MTTLKIAIQKNGRLSDDSRELLAECGIKFSNSAALLKSKAVNFPIEALFLRDDDIPQYVEQNVADIGIIGENIAYEKKKNVETVEYLGFAGCRLSLAIPREEVYTGLQYFMNKKIATSYPVVLKDFLQKHNIIAEVEEISGSVEIAPGIGLANAVCDIVSSGSSLIANGLAEVETILKSQAIIISSKNLGSEKETILKNLLFRIRAVKNARENKYILLNAPESSIDEICSILPGMKSPTILSLTKKGWCSIHAVVSEDVFWEKIDLLKKAGAEGILVIPIEKMIL